MTIIYDIYYSRITMNELVMYIAKQARQQKYNDYNGVTVTQQVIKILKSIVKYGVDEIQIRSLINGD